MSIKTRNYISFFGMMRSGNHAVINSIYRLYDSPKAFLNNRELINRVKAGKGKRDILSKNYLKANKKNLILVSYEDEFINSIDYDTINNNYCDTSNIDKRFNILCIRDPFNTFASRMKNKWTKNFILKYKDMEILQWKIYAKEYLGITNNMPDKIVVNFNSWFSEKEYRMNLSDKLGVLFSDKKWNLITKEGNGSSWKNKKGNKNADVSGLSKRWMDYRKDKFYRSLFRDDEIWELSSKIFGKFSDIEREIR